MKFIKQSIVTLFAILLLTLLTSSVSILAQTPDEPDPIIDDPVSAQRDEVPTDSAGFQTQEAFTVQAVSDELAVIDLTNNLRASLGRECLRYSSQLTNAARLHARDMHDNNYFSHISLDGRTFTQRISAQGYNWNAAAENIAAGNSTAQATFNQWFNSSGHYNNMINANYHEIGVGYYSGPNGYGHYWVMVLGRRSGVDADCTETNMATNMNNLGTITTVPDDFTFSWTHDTTTNDDFVPAENYRVFVQNGNVTIDQTFTKVSVCGGGTSCSVTIDAPSNIVNGTYNWWLVSSSTDGSDTWTPTQTFTLAIPPPEAVNKIAPAQNGIILDGNVTITWGLIEDIDWYRLIVIRSSNGSTVLDTWFGDGTNITCTTQCSHTQNYTNGLYTWWISGYSFISGQGDWATAGAFRAGPPPPVAPTGLVTSGSLTQPPVQPTYTWNNAGDADWYQVYVSGPNGVVVNKWYEASQICASSCSVTPNISLANGNYSWWVGGWNVVGQTWNTVAATFTVNSPAPVATQGLATSGSLTVPPVQPTYTWDRDTNAVWYQVYVSGPNGVVLNRWYEASQICASSCSVTPNISLGNGNYSWWVGGWNVVGQRWNTVAATFTVNIPAPVPTEGLATTGPPIQPTYTWDRDTNALWYQVYISGPNGAVLNMWYEASTICASSCSITPSIPLSNGNYSWWVGGWNPTAQMWNTAPATFTINE